MTERARVVALMGPTASGKTALGIECAQAFNGEVVSVDSALIYRHLDIGSAKPSMDERQGVPHHLIDIQDPWQPYSAAAYAADAQAAIADIVSRGKLPILVGGTGLYFQALLQGLGPMPAASPEIRARLNAEADQLGWQALHTRLKGVDPDAAARIHATDAQRIQRALEVYELSGVPITRLQEQGRAHRERRFHALKIIVAPSDRAILHERIARRFEQMLEHGFLDEVRRLRELPDMKAVEQVMELPSVRAVGYRQAWLYLDGKYTETEFKAASIAATRQLAKRQWTWLRNQFDALQFDPTRLKSAELMSTIRRFVS